MLVKNYKPKEASVSHLATDDVCKHRLREIVEELAYPRHYGYNYPENVKARDWLVSELESYGLDVSLQGEFDNVVAERKKNASDKVILLGAHYDTVPTTPGADDNNSAIAVCLEAARVLSKYSDASFRVVIFNREEDGLLGSYEYVDEINKNDIAEVHIFEMVGYFTSKEGSQKSPAGLPISLPDKGNFIGLLSNSKSNGVAKKIGTAFKMIGSNTPMLSLKTYFGIEKVFTDLLRSDHTPFWEAGIPAVMWTDTSEFRNPNYHAPTDTPDTLDYSSMADVTKVMVQHVLNRSTK